MQKYKNESVLFLFLLLFLLLVYYYKSSTIKDIVVPPRNLHETIVSDTSKKITQTAKKTKTYISPFDHLFRQYAPRIGWNWRLLASLAFHESRFNPREKSRAGALGVMQLMPRTASNFGLTKKNIFDPAMNIEAGVEYIKSLNMIFHRIENKQEKIKFVIAAYNSGPAHILDAMALAKKYKKSPYLWFHNVEYFLSKKNEPTFYNDSVVKYGHFNSKETTSLVKKTLRTYQQYMALTVVNN